MYGTFKKKEAGRGGGAAVKLREIDSRRMITRDSDGGNGEMLIQGHKLNKMNKFWGSSV